MQKFLFRRTPAYHLPPGGQSREIFSTCEASNILNLMCISTIKKYGCWRSAGRLCPELEIFGGQPDSPPASQTPQHDVYACALLPISGMLWPGYASSVHGSPALWHLPSLCWAEPILSLSARLTITDGHSPQARSPSLASKLPCCEAPPPLSC